VNALEKLEPRDEQRETVLEEARSAALQKAQEAIRELKRAKFSSDAEAQRDVGLLARALL
jgi:hypothetical protein